MLVFSRFPINKNFEIPNWRLQIETIITELDKHDIIHGDWTGENLLYHAETKTIKVIDFSVCRLPGQRFTRRLKLPCAPLKHQTLSDYIHCIDGGKVKIIDGNWKHKKKIAMAHTKKN